MIPLTDNPVTKLNHDAFGFEPYVRQLDACVRNAKPLPLTVGVFGGWGTGKSSFLGMWRDLLEQIDPAAPTVWFSPWKYDQKVEVWSALLHTVLAEIGRKPKLRDKAVRLARAATWLSLRTGLGHAASLATAGVVGKEQINTLLDGFSKDDAEQYHQINRFEQDFASTVEDAVGESGRLVVFVDDLDRCTPESAITVLESLKLFLGNARCVFVLALDVDVLAAVSTNKFRGALAGAPEESVSGMRYLEKIVQLPFFLPEVGFPALRRMLSPSVGDLAAREAFWEILRVGLGTNPRRLKRFVNVLNLAMAHQSAGEPDSPRPLQLAKLLVIRSEHREFFHRITQDPGHWQEAEQEGLDGQRPELRKLLNLGYPPAPSGEDGDGESAIAWADCEQPGRIRLYDRGGERALRLPGALQVLTNFKTMPVRTGVGLVEPLDSVEFAVAFVGEFAERHPDIAEPGNCVLYIGHPAGWPREAADIYREQLEAALRPFEVRLVPESQSAFLHVHDEARVAAGTQPVLVVDVGSSTTDFTLVTDVAENLPYGHALGCRAIDEQLAARVIAAVPDPDDRARLAQPAENALLRWLCRRHKEAAFAGVDTPAPATRDWLAGICWPILARIDVEAVVSEPGGMRERLRHELRRVRDHLGDRRPELS